MSVLDWLVGGVFGLRSFIRSLCLDLFETVGMWTRLCSANRESACNLDVRSLRRSMSHGRRRAAHILNLYVPQLSCRPSRTRPSRMWPSLPAFVEDVADQRSRYSSHPSQPQALQFSCLLPRIRPPLPVLSCFIATPIRLTTAPVLASAVEDVAATSSSALLRPTSFSTSRPPVLSSAVEDVMVFSISILLIAIRILTTLFGPCFTIKDVPVSSSLILLQPPSASRTPPVMTSPLEDVVGLSNSVLLQLTSFSSSRPPVPSSCCRERDGLLQLYFIETRVRLATLPVVRPQSRTGRYLRAIFYCNSHPPHSASSPRFTCRGRGQPVQLSLISAHIFLNHTPFSPLVCCRDHDGLFELYCIEALIRLTMPPVLASQSRTTWYLSALFYCNSNPPHNASSPRLTSRGRGGHVQPSLIASHILFNLNPSSPVSCCRGFGGLL